MPYTDNEKKLHTVSNDWFSVMGGIIDEDDPDKGEFPFWQFRIAIKPTRDNTLKAARALKKIKQFQEDEHPEFKVFIPDADNQLHTWDRTLNGGDRDQRGKEICVYMEYSRGNHAYYDTVTHYPKAAYLKELMLDMWKLLEDENVEMAYITPGPGEKELQVTDGSLTPFSYSSNKPYIQRHGLLHSDNYNPLQFHDPLGTVDFSPDDLKKRKISPLKAGCSAKRIAYQRQHYAEGLTDAIKTLRTPFEKDKIYSDTVSLLSELLKGSGEIPADSLTQFDKTIKEPDGNFYHEPFSALGISGQTLFKDVGMNLKHNPAQAKTLLNQLHNKIVVEKKTAVEEMFKVVPDAKITVEDLDAQFDLNPRAFHRLYQRFILLAQEKQTIQREHLHLDQLMPLSYPLSYYQLDKDNTLEAARNLLNDYTKGNSWLTRVGMLHWRRHHTSEVHAIVKQIDNQTIQTMDQLIDSLKQIALVNTQGSLSRRIDLIVCRHLTAIREAEGKENAVEIEFNV